MEVVGNVSDKLDSIRVSPLEDIREEEDILTVSF